MSKYNLEDIYEGMTDKEYSDALEAERLEAHPEKDKIKAIQALMDKEKSIANIKRMNPKADEKSLKNLSKMEENLDHEVADRIEGFLNIPMKKKFLDVGMDLIQDIIEDEPFEIDDIVSHLANELNRHFDGAIGAGDKLANIEHPEWTDDEPIDENETFEKARQAAIESSQEAAGIKEEVPSSSMLKINNSVKDAPTAAKAMIDFYNQMAEKEHMDFLNNAKFKIAFDKLKDLAGDEADAPVQEAQPIPTSPGKIEIGDDGEPYVAIASNAKRKMAMRSVLDILKDEMGVSTDDAFDYIKAHKEDLFDGSVDAFDKDEVVNDYKEYHDDYKLRKHVINLVMKEKSVPISVAQEFFNTHIDDIINNVSHDSDPHPRFMDDDEILDEFEEFASVNYESGTDYIKERGQLTETVDEDTWVMAEKAITHLGTDQFAEALVRAMSTDDAKLYITGILRDWDIPMADEDYAKYLNESLNEGVVKNMVTLLSDYGTESEINTYMDSVGREFMINPKSVEDYNDFNDDDWVEDFREWINDKYEDVREHFNRFK